MIEYPSSFVFSHEVARSLKNGLPVVALEFNGNHPWPAEAREPPIGEGHGARSS